MERLEFEALYERHRGALRAYVRRRADDGSIDDVLAHVWLTAWRRRRALPDDVLPWLFGTARRTLANERRGQRRRAALRARAGREQLATKEPDPSSSSSVLNALSKLADKDREAILLVAWDGLDNQSAARVIGCSNAAFATRLHRARLRLRILLDDAEARSPVASSRAQVEVEQ